MATASGYNDENSSASESDVTDELDSDEDSEVDSDCQSYEGQPCKYYNQGGCRDAQCSYLHVCKYALKGNCRYGSRCKLNHSRDGRRSSGGRNRAADQSASAAPQLTNGQYYQWQLNDGNGWLDIDNDHIIEVHYSQPHTKSIKIYNTPYGAVSIDFNRMRVPGKSLRVRRLDDGKTEWIWYCTLGKKWHKYGDKDSKGNTGPVRSSDIEREFQSDQRSSFTFNIGSETLEIKFREMCQVGKKRKRKVTRRPSYRDQQGVQQATATFQNLHVGTKPQWQFEGDRGAWHKYKRRTGSPTECSVTSEDIEKSYQQNSNNVMPFTVNGRKYQLNFGAMKQTCLTTNRSRNVRRVLV